MSNLAIRKALEVKLDSLIPNLATAWEDDNFNSVAGVPYQEINLLFASPENPTMGDGFYRQRGYLQVTLRWPSNNGPNDVGERAELIRQAFKRGLSLTANGVKTVVEETPEVGGGRNIDGRYVVIVKVKFYADIFS